MTRSGPHGAPARATGEGGHRRAGEARDGADAATAQGAGIRKLYDTALARTAVSGDRSLQRYVAVLIAAPRSA